MTPEERARKIVEALERGTLVGCSDLKIAFDEPSPREHLRVFLATALREAVAEKEAENKRLRGVVEHLVCWWENYPFPCDVPKKIIKDARAALKDKPT